MPNATTSLAQTAQQMTRNVKDGLAMLAEDVHACHDDLGTVKDNLHALVEGSNDGRVEAMIAQVETAQAKLAEGYPLVQDGSNKAVDIETGI